MGKSGILRGWHEVGLLDKKQTQQTIQSFLCVALRTIFNILYVNQLHTFPHLSSKWFIHSLLHSYELLHPGQSHCGSEVYPKNTRCEREYTLDRTLVHCRASRTYTLNHKDVQCTIASSPTGMLLVGENWKIWNKPHIDSGWTCRVSHTQ